MKRIFHKLSCASSRTRFSNTRQLTQHITSRSQEQEGRRRRRSGEYGDACLRLHTDRAGERVRRTQSGQNQTAQNNPYTALKAGEHAPLPCPYVGVSTHPIFSRPPPPPSLRPPALYSALSSVKINSVPTPSVLITLMFWLWALMISLTMERPSPVPFRSFPREASIL